MNHITVNNIEQAKSLAGKQVKLYSGGIIQLPDEIDVHEGGGMDSVWFSIYPTDHSYVDPIACIYRTDKPIPPYLKPDEIDIISIYHEDVEYFDYDHFLSETQDQSPSTTDTEPAAQQTTDISEIKEQLHHLYQQMEGLNKVTREIMRFINDANQKEEEEQIPKIKHDDVWKTRCGTLTLVSKLEGSVRYKWFSKGETCYSASPENLHSADEGSEHDLVERIGGISDVVTGYLSLEEAKE